MIGSDGDDEWAEDIGACLEETVHERDDAERAIRILFEAMAAALRVHEPLEQTRRRFLRAFKAAGIRKDLVDRLRRKEKA